MSAAFAGLDVRSEVYLGSWTQLPSTGPGSVRNTAGIQISRGRPDFKSQMLPSTAAFQVDNRDFRWSFRNALSPYYGQLVQNSPIRFSVPSSLAGIPAYLRLETDTASYVSAPDSSGTPPPVLHTTSFNVVASTTGAVTIPATTTGSALVVAVNCNGATSNNTVSTITGGGGSGWSKNTGVGSAVFTDVEVWDNFAVTAGTTSVTINASGGTGTQTVTGYILEIGGLPATSAAARDQPQSHSTATTGSSWTSNNTATLAQTNDIAIGIVAGSHGSLTIVGPSSGGWTNLAQLNQATGTMAVLVGYNGLSSTAALAYAGTFTGATSAQSVVIVTYKAATPGTSLQVTSGTLSVRADCKITDWTSNHILMAKDNGSSARSWWFYTGPDGSLNLGHYDGSTAFATVSTLPVPYFGQRLAVRADYNISAQTVTFFTAPTMAGSWTQLGAVVATGAASLSGAAGQPVQVGNGQANTLGMYGEIYEAQILSTGTTLADPVFTSQTPGVSSFADAQGNTWTLAGTSELSGRLYRFHGELAGLTKTADPSSRNAYAPASAGGITRRLQQQQRPADSAMKRAYLRLPSSLHLAAYWPGEDAAAATQIGQAAGSIPMGNSGLTMSSFSGFACSAPIPVMNGGTATALVDPSSVSWTDNVVRFLLAFSSSDDTPANNAIIARFYTQGTVARVDLRYGTGGSLQMIGYNAAGGTVFTGSTTGFGLPTLAQCRVSMEVLGSGNFNLWVLTPGGTATGGGSTWSGTVGAVTGVAFGGGLTSSAMGHFSVQGVTDGINDLSQPLNAWLGETAGNRFSRLAGEEGYACRITGPPSRSVPMGYQTQQTISALLQECENTDQGLMFEPRQVLGLGYVTNWALCQQAALAVANYTQADIDRGFSPASDDTRVVNDVTMTAADGSTARQVLTSGPMSTAAPPSGAGRFDTSLTVNPVTDSALASLAGWYLHVRTADEDRYPAIPFQIARGGIPQAVPLLDIGSYLQVINPPSWVTTGPVRQLIAGYTETIGPQPAWGFAFNGVPESPYEVLTLDDTVYGRVDITASTLNTGVAAGTTSLSIATTTGPLWSTTGGDYPQDVGMGGERLTVTAVSGSSSPQTFTVTRAVNGISKSHSAGETIDLWFPPYVPLY